MFMGLGQQGATARIADQPLQEGPPQRGHKHLRTTTAFASYVVVRDCACAFGLDHCRVNVLSLTEGKALNVLSQIGEREICIPWDHNRVYSSCKAFTYTIVFKTR